MTEPIREFVSVRPRQKAMEVAVAQLNASTPPGSDWDPAEVAKVAARSIRAKERSYRAWADAFGDPGLLQFEEWVEHQATRIHRSRRAHATSEAADGVRIGVAVDEAEPSLATDSDGEAVP